MQISPLSDRSLLIQFGFSIDVATNEKVFALHQALQQFPFEGFVESVPAFASLAVFYDVVEIKKTTPLSAHVFVAEKLRSMITMLQQGEQVAKNIKAIPVCYDPVFGIDLRQIGEARRLTLEQIIHLHTNMIYRVYMIGFMPGFAYMGTVDEHLVMPRRDQPRLRVSAGSVGIAGRQTGIYPMDAPGGWHIIGKTPLALFNKNEPSPCFLHAGDEVQFVSINYNEYKTAGGH